MTRHHLRPLPERILAALRRGETDTTALRIALRTKEVVDVLRRLEAVGRVRCVTPRAGNEPAVWALSERQERHT